MKTTDFPIVFRSSRPYYPVDYSKRKTRISLTFAPPAASLGVHEDVLEHVAALLVGALVLDALHETVLKHDGNGDVSGEKFILHTDDVGQVICFYIITSNGVNIDVRIVRRPPVAVRNI